jgi:hypothetical protein
LFRFVLVSLFFADIERKGSYFAFDHSEERIKRNISFHYRNELKIRSKKRIGFMHVDITSLEGEDLLGSPLRVVFTKGVNSFVLLVFTAFLFNCSGWLLEQISGFTTPTLFWAPSPRRVFFQIFIVFRGGQLARYSHRKAGTEYTGLTLQETSSLHCWEIQFVLLYPFLTLSKKGTIVDPYSQRWTYLKNKIKCVVLIDNNVAFLKQWCQCWLLVPLIRVWLKLTSQ